MHLVAVLYYTDIIANVFSAYPSLKRCVAFAPIDPDPVRGGMLLAREEAVFIAVAKNAARALKRECVLVGSPRAQPTAAYAILFAVKRAIFSVSLAFLNQVVVLARRPRKVRILAFDYWRNIAPILSSASSSEVLMLERMEAFAAGFKNIFNYRMGFLQLDSYITRKSARRKEAKNLFAQRLEELNKSFDFSFATFRGVSHADILSDALEVFVSDALDHSLSDIDAAYVLLERTRPDVILMRITASVTQPRFPIVAQVAKVLGVPAIEIQHGLDYNGPGTPLNFYNAEYRGVYGQLCIDEIKAATKDDYGTLVSVGSPRFDVYASVSQAVKNNTSSDTLSVVVVASSPCLGVLLDTYDVEKYFAAVGAAVKKIPNLKVIIKLRPGAGGQELYRPVIAKAFEGVSHTIVHSQPLTELLAQSDIAVSCYSTVALEAMICGVPIINLALSPAEAMMSKYHFAQYAAAGAMEIADTEERFETVLRRLTTDPEMRSELRSKSEVFLKKNFLFDGRASQRVVTLIESLAKSRHPY